MTLTRLTSLASLVAITLGLVYFLVPFEALAAATGQQALLNSGTGGNAQSGNTIAWLLYKMVVGIFVSLAGMAGVALSAAINYFVVGFGSLYTGGIGNALEFLWGLIRDLFNIALIFGIIYIGFKMILDSSDSQAKRTLATLIIAALLVNFSLFIAKFIIDFTNVLATVILTQIVNLSGLPTAPGGGPDIVGAFAGTINLLSVYNVTALSGGSGLFSSLNGAAFGYIFTVAILFIVLAIVAFAGAFLLTVRFISLCIYIVFSPLMFLGWVFPFMKGTSTKFMTGLLSKAFVAPAYLFMLYLSLSVVAVMAGPTGILGNPNFATGLAPSGNSLSYSASNMSTVIIILISAMGFMLASVIVAQKLGADGANATVRVMNNIGSRGRRFAQNTATYAPRFVGRNVANKTGAASKRGLTRLQNVDTTNMGRYNPKRMGVGLARNTTVDRNVRGVADKAEKAKFGMPTTVSENRKRRSEIDDRVKDERLKEAGLAAQTKRDAGGTLTIDEEQNLAKLQSMVSRKSVKQFEEMTQEEREQLAAFMSSSQVEKLMESSELDPSQKTEIANKRSEAIQRIIRENRDLSGEILTDELGKLSVSQLETLGQEFIMENAADLTDKQIDDLKKNKNLTDGQKTQVLAARKQKIDNRVNVRSSNPAEFKKMFEVTKKDAATGSTTSVKKKASELAKLPPEVITKPQAVRFMDPSVLEKIDKDRDNQLTFDNKAEIRSNILTSTSTEQNVIDAQNWLQNTPKGKEFGNTRVT